MLSCTGAARFEHGRLIEAHLLAFDYPALFAPIALAAAACWLAYFRFRARLR